MTDLVAVLYGGIVRGASLSQFKKKKKKMMNDTDHVLQGYNSRGI